MFLFCALLALYSAFQALFLNPKPVLTTLAMKSIKPVLSPAPKSGPIDLNSADLQDLTRLKGLSPRLAKLILEARANRPFRYIEDLRAIPGIGEKRIASWREFCTVLAPAQSPTP